MAPIDFDKFFGFWFFGCAGSLMLWAFSSSGEQGLLFVVVHRFLVAVSSPVVSSSLVATQGSWQLAVGCPAKFSWGDSSLTMISRVTPVLLQ